MGQREKILFRNSKQWGSQRRRQRQIIFGRGQKRQQRHDIAHSQFCCDLKAVRARNGQSAHLTGTDDFVEKSCAPADKDQHIARLHRPRGFSTRKGRFGFDLVVDEIRNLSRQNHICMRFADPIHGVEPYVRVLFFGLRNDRPQIHAPGKVFKKRDVLFRFGKARGIAPLKRCIHNLQNCASRPEGMRQ